LAARNLSSKGLKSQLLARLLKAVKSEQAKEEGRQDEADENEEDVSPPSKEEDDKKFRDNKDVSNRHWYMYLSSFIEHTDIEYKIISWEYFRSLISIHSRYLQHDEDKRKLYERERTVLEKRYTLPDSSHIIVHPSRMAKSGKFDCTVMSLSVLLDYRPEDTKVFWKLFSLTYKKEFYINLLNM